MHSTDRWAAHISVGINDVSGDGLALSLRQFSEAWRVLCGPSPGFTLHTDDAVEYIFSGLPIGFFNLALLTERSVSAAALKGAAHDACAWAADKGVPWLFVIHDGLAAGVEAAAVLDTCGLAPLMPLTGMVAEQIAPAAHVSEDLELSVPEEETALAAILDVNALAYNTPLDAAKPVVAQPSFWTGHLPVLGRKDDRPVSSAAVFMVDGLRYVALVATDPAHQRRGYAEAAMRHALDVAGRTYGNVPTVLHATDAGRPIYARMGYTTIAHHTVYMEKRFLDGH